MIKTNLEKLVDMAVCGDAASPSTCDAAPRTGADGAGYLPVRLSGINFSVKVGDPALDWAGAHETAPGVALANPEGGANEALVALSCIGNDAVVVGARLDGKDVKLVGFAGTVTGKTCDRVLVHFPRRVVEKLCVGDRIQVRASGAGLKLLDYPDVTCLNLSPRLLKALNPSEKGGRVRIPVAKVIPGKLLGHGLGCATGATGDLDIQAGSPEAVKEYALDQLRLGDLVALADIDAATGGRWQPGSVSVGVVVHGASRRAGRGPGVSPILASPKGAIEPIITRKANLADLLGLV
jgi:hypothetical protein